MTTATTCPYYSIVTFGSASYGDKRSYYTNYSRAHRDAKTLGGGSLTTVRIVGCRTRQEAIDADISDSVNVVTSI